ncbi:MAG: YgiT-type zinc finger protein [Candidatus Binatia bacterium]
MDPLVRIERLVLARRVEFTMKAEVERLRDGLAVEDVLESIVNADAIKKTVRSRSRSRELSRELLYVIESPTYTGVWVYTKGVLRSSMSSSHRSSRSEHSTGVGRCPTCGSARVARVTEDVVFTVGRRRRRFSQVDHERCASCGERIFDLETSKRFDVVLGRRRRPRAASVAMSIWSIRAGSHGEYELKFIPMKQQTGR